jgi:uncharacterized delta-60 repeat protein
MAIQPSDGKSVLAGWTDSGSKTTGNDNFAVARYTTAGQLDATFGSGKGYVTTDVAGNLKGNVSRDDQARAVAIDSSGRIVTAGWATNGTYDGFALARYTSSGALDTSFNNGGSLPGTVISFPILNTTCTVTSLAIQADGKIVVGGTDNIPGYFAGHWILQRYNANGTLDTTFGTGGTVIQAFSGGSLLLNGIAVDSSGNIVAVGWGDPSGLPSVSFLVARFTSSGTLDTMSFGNGNGYVNTGVNASLGNNGANAVTIEANGDIAAAGSSQADSTGVGQFTIVEYTPSGALDPTFGGGTGIFTSRIPVGNTNSSSANAIAIDSGGNFLPAGWSGLTYWDFALAKVDPPVAGGSSTGTTAAAPETIIASLLHTDFPSLLLDVGPAANHASTADGSLKPFSLAASPTAMLSTAGIDVSSVPRAGALSGGGEEAIDQVFVDWQPEDRSDTGAVELQNW